MVALLNILFMSHKSSSKLLNPLKYIFSLIPSCLCVLAKMFHPFRGMVKDSFYFTLFQNYAHSFINQFSTITCLFLTIPYVSVYQCVVLRLHPSTEIKLRFNTIDFSIRTSELEVQGSEIVYEEMLQKVIHKKANFNRVRENLRGAVIWGRYHLLIWPVKILFPGKIFCTAGKLYKYRRKMNYYAW